MHIQFLLENLTKRPVVRPRSRRKDDIKMDLKEATRDDVD
jgi:hypothetical protein